jgi:hypothetical protein
MANFAVLDGINVVNVIVADSLEIAEEVTSKTCVEYTNENATPGGTYENEIFLQPQPYPSWVLNENNSWVAPVSYPSGEGIYRWDESVVNWVKDIEA